MTSHSRKDNLSFWKKFAFKTEACTLLYSLATRGWRFSDPADIRFWSLIPATFWSVWLLFACPDPIAYISQWYKPNIVLFVVYHVYYQPRNMEGQESQVKYSGGGKIQSITEADRRFLQMLEMVLFVFEEFLGNCNHGNLISGIDTTFSWRGKRIKALLHRSWNTKYSVLVLKTHDVMNSKEWKPKSIWPLKNSTFDSLQVRVTRVIHPEFPQIDVISFWQFSQVLELRSVHTLRDIRTNEPSAAVQSTDYHGWNGCHFCGK